MSSTIDRNEVPGASDATDEQVEGREWDEMAVEPERVDDRDLENIDLDIECWNDAMERKARA